MQRFLGDLIATQSAVTSRILLATQAGDFIGRMRGHKIERIVAVAEDLHDKGFRLQMQAAHDLMRADKDAEAVATIKRVIANSSGNLEIQFNAIAQFGTYQVRELMKSDKPQSWIARQSSKLRWNFAVLPSGFPSISICLQQSPVRRQNSLFACTKRRIADDLASALAGRR